MLIVDIAFESVFLNRSIGAQIHLATLSDENLHNTNCQLARRERALLKDIIDHLREIYTQEQSDACHTGGAP